jgi:ribonuclease BN (tRNA processing enzyme)
MAVRLSVIGSSPAWPNPGGACSGYLVDRRLLLDCGPGVLANLRRREPWPRVEAIAITHLHLDHWGDLIPWVWGSLFGPGGATDPPELWLPPGSTEQLRPVLRLLGDEQMFERAFRVSEFDPGTPFAAAGLEVTAIPVRHYDLDAYGFRVQGEQLLAYSGDTGPCGGLVEVGRDADLFVCEATLSVDHREGPERGHLSEQEARQAADAAGASRLLLTHRPDERPLAEGDLAHDGLELDF